MTSNPFSPGPQHKEPARWKGILAWVAVIFGVLMIIASLASGTLRDTLGGFFSGVALMLPGAWYILHNRREKNGAVPMKRHWGLITVASITLLILAGVTAPAKSPDEGDSAVEESSTTAAPSSTTSPEQTSSSKVTASSEPTTPPPAPSPTLEEQGESEENNDVDAYQVAPPAPAPEVSYEEHPVYEEAPAPAPAPAPQYSGGSGRTCAEIGHKVYPGDPEYSLERDKNGDGVGCESQPG
ncbi:hypothetical protein ACL1HT_12960 [Corynebacterium striatum]|uniref:excalibur calcium-binding domain-containing protein n=1 Tax=Corynebacterium striatum TaxID=43770 RepID=UPI000673CA41|nr:excalibur calcium-binding domain-containing protein [Corynebacterium striatum]EGT5575739.1 hypothetical protein [Corynebacterium striatum]EGT5595053.1 hypothetical protein [Corynebacterium striatum]MDK8788766.1 hypothetical protein [Corynebacterium striatum]NHX52920.1 hypothetical protein [Corynebacterium striatum]NHY37532.1 hypothetical protein [Corynebacterium striatum]